MIYKKIASLGVLMFFAGAGVEGFSRSAGLSWTLGLVIAVIFGLVAANILLR